MSPIIPWWSTAVLEGHFASRIDGKDAVEDKTTTSVRTILLPRIHNAYSEAAQEER
jgi:hypothetical protein